MVGHLQLLNLSIVNVGRIASAFMKPTSSFKTQKTLFTPVYVGPGTKYLIDNEQRGRLQHRGGLTCITASEVDKPMGKDSFTTKI
jgi:hypothetical protein